MVIWTTALGICLILLGVLALLPVAVPIYVYAIAAIVVGLLVLVGK